MAVRLSRKFYGTPVSRIFDPDVHSVEDAYTDDYTGCRMARGQMAWLVDKADRLPEDDPKAMSIRVSAHFTYDEPREVGAVLCGCTEDVAPTRFAHDGKPVLLLQYQDTIPVMPQANPRLSTPLQCPDVKIVCKVRSDFSDIPVSKFPRMRNPKTGKAYFEVDFQLEANFKGGELNWRLLWKGQEWGCTTVSFDD